MLLIEVVCLAACGLSTPTTYSTPSGATAISSATPFPTATSLVASQTPSPLLAEVASHLRIAYTAEGNLYVQNGNAAAVRLTSSGEDWSPRFSEDGEQILFFRGHAPQELYAIDADGGGEQALLTARDLADLSPKYGAATAVKSFDAVPNAHLVLFNTKTVDLQHPDETGLLPPNDDLLLLDLDTNRIMVLLPPGRAQAFEISPDGQSVAVQAKGHIDVIDLEGRTVRRNLVTYTPTHPYDLKPGISWNPQSTELIVAVPAGDLYDMSGPEPFSVWRYSVDGSASSELTFDPPPLDRCCASPDGNWFLYKYYEYPGKSSAEIPGGLYLGNLHDSSSRLYAPDHLFAWSPDSQHFMYGENEMFLGSVNEEPKSLGSGRFLGWLDAQTFLYYRFESDALFIGDLGNGASPMSAQMHSRLTLEGGDSFTFAFLNHAP